MNYFEIDALSNSELGQLKKGIFNVNSPKHLQHIFDFGNLVDALLTEPPEVVQKYRQLCGEEKWQQALKMVEQCEKDPVIKLMIDHSIPQYIFVRLLNVKYLDYQFNIRSKCKFDLFMKTRLSGIDFKTLSVSNYQQFKDSIHHFDYDRQAAFYMDLARIKRFWIIGISKINFQIFKLCIQHGDHIYTRGKKKYSYWAWKYHTLIHNLIIP